MRGLYFDGMRRLPWGEYSFVFIHTETDLFAIRISSEAMSFRLWGYGLGIIWRLDGKPFRHLRLLRRSQLLP
jgi:hypothetical protein